MAETGQDLVCWAGDHIDIFITVMGWDGLPLDLTDATLIWGLGSVTTLPAILEKSSANAGEIQVLDPLTGQIVVHLQPADTIGLAGPMRHELKIVDAFAALETILTGHVQINKASLHPGMSKRRPLRAVDDIWAAE